MAGKHQEGLTHEPLDDTLVVKCYSTFKNEIRDEAQKHGVSMSALVTKVLQTYLDTQELKIKFRR